MTQPTSLPKNRVSAVSMRRWPLAIDPPSGGDLTAPKKNVRREESKEALVGNGASGGKDDGIAHGN